MEGEKKKTIIITGVNGQIGREIARQLQEDYDVYGISIEPENQTETVIHYMQVDIADINTFSSLPERIDAIVHCAAIISDNGLSNTLIDVNCKGVQNLAAYAISAKCKEFIYFSSLPIIGKPSQVPITEEHPIKDPPTVYHATKLFGELILKNLLNDTRLSIFRIPSPVGRNTPSNKIIPVFVRNAIEGHDFVLRGTGARIQNYIDVRDIARAVKCAIEKESRGIYNIASRISYSNREVAELCIQLFGASSKITYQGTDEEEDFQWIVSVEKAKRELGFETSYSIQDTLIELSKNYAR